MGSAATLPRVDVRPRPAAVGAGVVVLATLAVGLGWLLPTTESVGADLVGIASVAGISLALLLALALVGKAAALAMPAALRDMVGAGPVLALGLAVVALLGMLEHAIVGRIVVSPAVALALGVVTAAWRIVALARRSGRASVVAAARTRLSHGVATLDWVPMALAGVAMLPVARHGLTAWTLAISDWHRYAGSAVVWLEGADAFVDSHPGDYGDAMATRAGFEKPAVTAMIVAAARWTGVHPVGLLAPLLIVLLAVLAASAAAMVRSGLASSPRAAVAASAPAALSIAVVLPIAHAQPGGIAATALLCAGVALATSLPRASTVVGSVRVGVLAGVVVGVGVASNATVAAAALPAALVVAAWLVLRGRGAARIVAPGALAAALAAIVIVGTQAARLARSLLAQVDGTAGVAIPLPTPFGVVGLEAIGGAPTPVAVVAWLAALAAIVALAWRQRASIDGAWVLGLVAVVVACAGGLAIVYGIDGYSTGKWLGIVVPIVVPPVVAWMAAVLAARGAVVAVGERLASVVVGGVLVVVPAVAASAFAAVHVVLPPTTLELASSQVLADEPVVNVDLDSRHSAGLVPLLVPAETVVSMDDTYAHASDPIGDVFLMDGDESSARDWTEQVAMPSSLVLGTLDLDASTGGVSLLTAGGSDHLFGGWIDTRPERTQLTADTAPGIVVLDVAGSPAAIVVTGFVDGPARVEVTVGDEIVVVTPRSGALAVRVPIEARDVVDGRIVVAVAVRQTSGDAQAIARIDGIELEEAR